VGGGEIFGGRRCLSAGGPDARLHREVSAILSALASDFQDKKPGYRLAIKSRLYALAWTYAREAEGLVSAEETAAEDRAQHEADMVYISSVAQPTLAEQRLEKVISLVSEHYDSMDIDLDAAADEAMLSRSQFCRFFKSATGLNFHEFLLSFRLRHAKEFLISTDIPINIIAENCGFASLATFNRVFKKEIGATPSRFRLDAKNDKN
jgi:AraC-like DNA-binding protein